MVQVGSDNVLGISAVWRLYGGACRLVRVIVARMLLGGCTEYLSGRRANTVA